ncbi:histidine phosphatase family protein [Arsenicicoccus piscis]|nr:histidine phosphatase family protein [Arsenicicoccus piscis]MCH8627693.1 histidine phosphatase family protein [Arsenicicoccus piscis]
MSSRVRTVVHLMRHGEVHNPTKVLYGRLPEFHLSELGVQMAELVGEHLSGHDVRLVVASPLERAQETAAPTARAHGVPIRTDSRIIEAGNYFEGVQFGVGEGSLRNPRNWWLVRNPLRPSWGEPYTRIAARMVAAIDAARAHAPGGDIVLVSHQLPVWTVRRHLQGERLWHDPRDRECTLASLTSLTYDGDELVSIDYTEPAASLLPGANATVGA